MTVGAEAAASPTVGLVVVAAGSSRRFGSDKLNVVLAGMTVLQRAVACLRQAFPRAPLAVVVPPGGKAARQQELARFDLTAVVAGGRERQDSVKAGVAALDLPDTAVVVVHDGARPFVPPADVRRVVEVAAACGAAVLAAPVVDTIKEVDEEGGVVRTLPRAQLVRSLTPQAFRAGLLRRAWADAGAGHWTDEAALLETLGIPVKVVNGDPRNLKLTCPEDLSLLRGLFPPQVRVGQGVDVHPFVAGRPLVLAGVAIPFELGLAGHSDADVVLHAVTDAVLGACGEGDIGEHFPPSDPRWAGTASCVFLRFALERAHVHGLRPVSCDVTVLAEKPKLAPFRSAMRQRLAELMDLPPGMVNLKATTTETLGFVGRGEGVVALAVVVLASS